MKNAIKSGRITIKGSDKKVHGNIINYKSYTDQDLLNFEPSCPVNWKIIRDFAV